MEVYSSNLTVYGEYSNLFLLYHLPLQGCLPEDAVTTSSDVQPDST